MVVSASSEDNWRYLKKIVTIGKEFLLNKWKLNKLWLVKTITEREDASWK